MEQQESFFTGSGRLIMLGSTTKQASNGRICLPITMPLTGQSVVGMPDWLGNAFEQVSKYAKTFKPEIEQIADIVVCFNNAKPADKLFDDPSARVPSAELKGFIVARAEDPDDPTVQLTFKLYAPFSRDFWAWLGEMTGHEVWMGFPKSLGGRVTAPKAEQENLDLPPAQVPDAETAVFAGDSNPVRDAPPERRKGSAAKKSGPIELKKYHETVTGKRR